MDCRRAFDPRVAIIAVVLCVLSSAPLHAGSGWVDADRQSCVDACNKSDDGTAPGRYAVPIGGKHDYYVCAGHIKGTPAKVQHGGSNEGALCIVANDSGVKALTRYKCLCTSDKIDAPQW
jgi:hypothetical protein